jgi:hypothetical protein
VIVAVLFHGNAGGLRVFNSAKSCLSAALIGKPEDSADDAMECYLSPSEHGARDDNTERQAR